MAKPSEPPAGIARLSGLLKSVGVEHRLLDANVEGLLHILGMQIPPEKATDVWTRRAVKDRGHNLSLIRDPILYSQLDRYKRTINDLSRLLAKASAPGISIGLANYEHKGLSPLRSRDLLRAAEQPEMNPFYPFFRSRLEGLFSKKVPLTVGISLNYLSQALGTFSMIGFIRREFPGIKVILGGGLVTSWLRNPGWNDPFNGLVDDLIAGPGEHQLLSLLGLKRTEENLPTPDYLALPTHCYLSPGFVLPYSASSGCYWANCTFCPEKAEGNPYAAIPVKNVISDLKVLTEKTQPVLIHLLDNAVSPKLLEAIAKNSPGVPWYGFARVSTLLSDPDFCNALKAAGCVMLKLGIESGDQRVLDTLEKGSNVETASSVLRNLRKAGIAAYAYLIFGTPAETEASARRTLDFTIRHSDSIDFLNLAIFNMPIFGKTFSGLQVKEFSDGDLSLYTGFSHPAGWDRKSVRLFLEREFKRHPAVAKILRNDPPVFTSNHAPFFAMADQGWGKGSR